MIRARRLSGALLALALLLAACSRHDAGGTSGASGADGTPVGLAQDDRIAWLLASRTRTEPFTADTSDLRAVLISKLASGQADPLAQAKLDLAQMGARALPELKRFFDANYSDAITTARVINALDVASLLPEGLGHELLMRGLDHPVGSVRLAALRGLTRQSTPQDFDRLEAVASLTGSEGQHELGMALWHADPARALRELPKWAEGGMKAEIVMAFAPRLGDVPDPQGLQAMRGLLERVQGEFRARLLSALARAGDAAALTELRTWLEDPEVSRREIAAHCLHDARLQRELLPRLRADGYAPIRKLCVEALGELALDDEIRSALQDAAGDPSDDVRLQALTVLVRAGDAAGENEALELLKGNKPELERALLVLRESWNRRAELAERALAVLDGLRQGQFGTLRVERSSIWRAISQVPLERAARILYEELQHNPSPERLFSAHRWFLTQIGNTGEAGWRFVRELWRQEGDPARRVDLLMASCYDRGESGRAFLEEALDSGRMTPLEVLFAAHELARMGPAERVAPRLKRITLGISDRAVRPALNNLLWSWYGLER